MTATHLEKRLRASGLLVLLGLLLNLVSLVVAHPLSFLFFMFAGCPLVLGGSLFYLYSLVTLGGGE